MIPPVEITNERHNMETCEAAFLFTQGVSVVAKVWGRLEMKCEGSGCEGQVCKEQRRIYKAYRASWSMLLISEVEHRAERNPPCGPLWVGILHVSSYCCLNKPSHCWSFACGVRAKLASSFCLLPPPRTGPRWGSLRGSMLQRGAQRAGVGTVTQWACCLLRNPSGQVLWSFASLRRLWEPFSRYPDCVVTFSWLTAFTKQACWAVPGLLPWTWTAPEVSSGLPLLTIWSRTASRKERPQGSLSGTVQGSAPDFWGPPAVGGEGPTS